MSKIIKFRAWDKEDEEMLKVDGIRFLKEGFTVLGFDKNTSFRLLIV